MFERRERESGELEVGDGFGVLDFVFGRGRRERAEEIDDAGSGGEERDAAEEMGGAFERERAAEQQLHGAGGEQERDQGDLNRPCHAG